MSHLQQLYAKAPDQQSLDADLLDQGLATEDEEGNVQPKIGVTTWTPVQSVTTNQDGEITDRTYADFLLVLVSWTENSRDHAGISKEKVEALKSAGTLANGTEIVGQKQDVKDNLNLHESEPKITTYGV